VGVKPQALDHECWHDYEVQAPLQTPGNDIGDHLAAGSSAAKEGVQVAHPTPKTGNTQVKPMSLHYSLLFSTVGFLRLQKNEFERPQINLGLSICTHPVIIPSTPQAMTFSAVYLVSPAAK
jgi:hypothetical protein